MNDQPHPGSDHRHSFAVDCSCECGIMLSDYVKELKRQRDRLHQEAAFQLDCACGERDDLKRQRDTLADALQIAYAALGDSGQLEARERVRQALRAVGRLS